MPIQFSKDDIGLYVALGMVGAGLGLMIGSIVTHRIAVWRMNRIIDEELDMYLDPDAEYVDGEDLREVYPLDTEEEEEDEEEDLDEELMEFIEEYEPNSVAIELIRAGVITIEEAKHNIDVDRRLKAQYTPQSYSGIYKPDAAKPELEDLVEMPEDSTPMVVDDHFVIYDDILEEDGLANVDVNVLYDPDDNSWLRLSAYGNLVELGGVEQYVSDTAWDEVEIALLRTNNPVFVQDTKRNKLYKFELVPSDEGDRMTQGLRGSGS